MKIYNEAPPLGKLLLIVCLIVICYLLYKGAKKLLEPTADNVNTINATASELTQLSNIGEKPSYSDAQFDSWADNLFTAMEGIGTDVDNINSVMNYMSNKADVLKLIKTFGLRKRTYNYWFSAGDDLNLNEWFTEELDSDEIKKINDILKAKGINYKF